MGFFYQVVKSPTPRREFKTYPCDTIHAFEGFWRVLDLFNSFLRLFDGLMFKYSQISSSSYEWEILKINLIDIWGYLKSFLQMVEDLKVNLFRSKNRKGYRSLIITSTHSPHFLRSKNHKCSSQHKCQNHNFWLGDGFHPVRNPNYHTNGDPNGDPNLRLGV